METGARKEAGHYKETFEYAEEIRQVLKPLGWEIVGFEWLRENPFTLKLEKVFQLTSCPQSDGPS